MESRMDYAAASPAALRQMLSLESFVSDCGLEHSLLELVKVRASQINGCAFCLDMHCRDARAGGESEQRLYAVSVWHEAPFFTPRERAALLWTEKLTLLSVDQVPDDAYEAVRPHFTDEELVNLTMAINLINAWNRLGVAFRSVPETRA